jgi:DNA invertase Pin-like site-specific DNA recombinase
MFRVAEGEGFEPPVPFQVQRFSSSTAGSEPLGKFPTLLLFSTGYKSVDLIRSAWKRFVLIVQPLQFHDSDTSLPHGEMLFQIIGAIAQWERSLIAERVRAGLQHARSQGRRLGRPPCRVLTPKEIVKLRKERIRSKTPFRTLAEKYGVSVFTAHALCARRD